MSESNQRSYDNPILAVINGIAEMVKPREPVGVLQEAERLDGKTCLVTGANSGLGKAVAHELAERGAKVIMACRSGIPQAGNELSEAIADPSRISMVALDLADLASVRACCDELKKQKVVLDRVVLNAGLMPQKSFRTKQGFEVMFGVHFVGNMALVRGLLENGVIPNTTYRKGKKRKVDTAQPRPRIVFVSSEAHRSGSPIELSSLGDPVDYNAINGMAQYGHSKRVMTAWAMELAGRLNTGETPDVEVHACCPGPVNSNIAREAPDWVKPALGKVMDQFFASPEQAMSPVIYLACSQSLEHSTGVYLHLMAKKEPQEQVLDPAIRQAVWEKAEAIYAGTQH